MREAEQKAGEARATYERMEHQRKVILALSMKAAEAEGTGSVSAQERDARASEQYQGILDDLYEARRRMELDVAEYHARDLYCRLWQTERATERAELRVLQAT